MSDRLKIILAILLFIAALLLPLIGLGIGWYNWDVQTGLWIMVITFLGLFSLGGVVLFRVQDLTWLTVSLPYLFGIAYTLSPDLIPLGGDDAVVAAVGSIMAYILALRKDPRTPKWIIIPLLIGAAYMFLGGPIPGGLDELIVNILAVALAGYGIGRTAKAGGGLIEPENPTE
ncbi:MAG TPA: hypothetical protein DEH25_07225 [Chloroflexi bacterium]|nr:hypothetical protein [Chloroflexota bacterium]